MMLAAASMATVAARTGGLANRAATAGIRHFAAIKYPEPKEGIKWKELQFRLETKDTTMVVMKCNLGEKWGEPVSMPYGPMMMEPSITALNYGQSLFEGMKAIRTSKGRVVMFRPKENARRMAKGAERFLMVPPSEDEFMKAVCQAVRANAHWIPPMDDGSLYIRPLLFGSSADLGVKPSDENTLCIYVTPVGAYYAGGARMKFIADHNRASSNGTGYVKAAGNYAPCFESQKNAKAAGFSDVIYLDAVNGSYVEEGAANNVFFVEDTQTGKIVHTPELGTILPGVTRDSVIQLLRLKGSEMGFGDVELRESRVMVDTVMKCSEAFAVGTAAVVTPIAHFSAPGKTGRAFDLANPGPMTVQVKKMLQDIMYERVEPPFADWIIDPFA